MTLSRISTPREPPATWMPPQAKVSPLLADGERLDGVALDDGPGRRVEVEGGVMGEGAVHLDAAVGDAHVARAERMDGAAQRVRAAGRLPEDEPAELDAAAADDADAELPVRPDREVAERHVVTRLAELDVDERFAGSCRGRLDARARSAADDHDVALARDAHLLAVDAGADADAPAAHGQGVDGRLNRLEVAPRARRRRCSSRAG